MSNSSTLAMQRSDITVYGVGTSRTLRVHWALAELGLPYRTEPLQSRTGETATADFTRLDPRQKIPVLQDGDFILTESPAIVTYLGERYGRAGCQLVPAGERARARYNEWLSFISMELDATSLYVLRRHEGLPEIYGAAPTASAAARAYFSKMIDAAAVKFGEDRAFLLGETLSGADIIMTTCLAWAKRLEIALPTVFAAYFENIAERPAFQAALVVNTINPAGR